MIRIVGTNHLMSKGAIEGIIRDECPDVIGVELCEFRLQHLIVNPIIQKEHEGVKKEGLVSRISSAIRKKAEEQKVVYGQDMIVAGRYALDHNLPLALLDRDINEAALLMEKLPLEEKERFGQELLKFQNESLNSKVNEDEVVRSLQKNFPIAYEFLIKGREEFIALQIAKTMLQHPNKKILIFLGKGHVKRVEELLK